MTPLQSARTIAARGTAVSLRSVRRWITSQAVLSGRRLAPILPPFAVDGMEWVMSQAGRRMPVLAAMVERNMRAAGVHRHGTVAAYFAQMALHFANAARLFKVAGHPDKVERLACGQIALEDSLAILKQAASGGRGVLLAPAHTTNYVLTLARLNLEVPICIFLRWSKDQRKLELKHDWCRAAGLRVVLEPASAANPTARAAACVELLRAGTVLAITPDIAQKADEGVPVRMFDRYVYLPSGTPATAMLAETPLIPLFGRIESGVQRLYFGLPIEVPSLGRAQGGRKAAIRQALQTWAAGFEQYIRACPEAWFLWGDSRWTRVFAMDPEYARPLDSPASSLPEADGSVVRTA